MITKIEIPIDPSLSPRAQLQPVLTALPPEACTRHPHVLLPVDVSSTITELLHPWEYYHGRRNLMWSFEAKYDVCSDCPHLSFVNTREGCAKYEGEWGKNLPVDANVAPLPIFNEWQNGLKARVCRYKTPNRPVPLLSAKLVPPFSRYVFEQVVYRRCIECALETAGATPLFAGCSFENFCPTVAAETKCLAKCRDFARQWPPRFLFLFGNTGTGKTHLAAAILREWLKRRRSGAWFTKFSQFVRQQRAHQFERGQKDEDERELSPLERAQTVDLLLLDELRFTGARDEEPLLFDLVSYRHEHFLPTVLTTNLTVESLEGELGSRVVDRIREAQFAALGFNWASKRREANAMYGCPRPIPPLQ